MHNADVTESSAFAPRADDNRVVLRANEFKVDILPCFIVRYAGMDSSIVSGLSETDAMPRRMRDAIKYLIEAGGELAAEIERLVPTSGSERAGRLLRLRRTIHQRKWQLINDRHSSGDPSMAMLGGGNRFLGALENYTTVLIEARELSSRLHQQFVALAQGFMASSAARGLTIASTSYCERLFSGDAHFLTSRGLDQNGYTLLQFASRAALKVSPFSFFGPVGTAELSDQLRISKLEGTQLLATAKITAKPVERAVQVSGGWNGTISRHQDYVYWVAQNGRSIRRAKTTALAPYLSESQTRAMPQGAPAPPEESQREATRAAGLWIDGGSSPEESTSLQLKPSELKIFSACGAQSRLQLIREWEQEKMPGAGSARGIAARLREDVHTTQIASLDTSDVKGLARSLATLEVEVARANPAARCRLALSKFYRQEFPGEHRVSFMEFAMRLFQRMGNTTGGNSNAASNLWAEILKLDPDANQGIEDILSKSLSKYQIGKHEDGRIFMRRKPGAPVEGINRRIFSGALLQPLYGDHGSDRWVANTVGAPAGKCFTRWAGIWPALDEKVQGWYRQQQEPHVIHAAFDDGLVFSTDTSLELFPAIVSIAASLHPRLAKLQQIALNELECRIVDDEVTLVHILSGCQVVLHYTSLLWLGARGWFSQLLCIFETGGLGGVLDLLRRRLLADLGVEATRNLPRLTLDDGIVLLRRRWLIDRKDIPLPPSASSVSEIVRHYVEWQMGTDLPVEVYFRRACRVRIGMLEKPQYCNWNSSAWLLFFHKYLTKVEGNLYIEEALPAATTSKGPFAEICINWYA